MILSSTIRTLIGGTVPSISPPKTAPGDGLLLPFRKERGDATGAGGVRVLVWGDSDAGAGGVGTVGAGGEGGGWACGEMPESTDVNFNHSACR